MPDPTTPPTPAEIAESKITFENVPDDYRKKILDIYSRAGSLPAFISAAERGIAPPSGEVKETVDGLARFAGDSCMNWNLHALRDLLESSRSLLLRLSAPPVAAPSGEAAPKPHTAKFTGEYYRALADGSKGVDSETFEDALNHAAYLADSVRTLSDGKAAAEAESNANAAGWKDAAERAEVMKQTAEGWKEKSDASESRCAALERALREILDCYVELVESGDAGFWDADEEGAVKRARAALSAEPAKPEAKP